MKIFTLKTVFRIKIFIEINIMSGSKDIVLLKEFSIFSNFSISNGNYY